MIHRSSFNSLTEYKAAIKEMSISKQYIKEQWKPPIENKPDFDTIDELRAEIELLKTDVLRLIPIALDASPGLSNEHAEVIKAAKARANGQSTISLDDLMKEAFRDGYYARSTYNDIEVSSFEEEWERAKPGYKL